MNTLKSLGHVGTHRHYHCTKLHYIVILYWGICVHALCVCAAKRWQISRANFHLMQLYLNQSSKRSFSQRYRYFWVDALFYCVIVLLCSFLFTSA